MHARKTLTRREFTVASALAILSGVAITVSGCGSSSPAAPSAASGDKVGQISSNHGHSAVITGAQLTAANALLLNIKGSSDHPHTVQLSAADISAIAGNQRVSRLSSTDSGHDHTVTFN